MKKFWLIKKKGYSCTYYNIFKIIFAFIITTTFVIVSIGFFIPISLFVGFFAFFERWYYGFDNYYYDLPSVYDSYYVYRNIIRKIFNYYTK